VTEFGSLNHSPGKRVLNNLKTICLRFWKVVVSTYCSINSWYQQRGDPTTDWHSSVVHEPSGVDPRVRKGVLTHLKYVRG